MVQHLNLDQQVCFKQYGPERYNLMLDLPDGCYGTEFSIHMFISRPWCGAAILCQCCMVWVRLMHYCSQVREYSLVPAVNATWNSQGSRRHYYVDEGTEAFNDHHQQVWRWFRMTGAVVQNHGFCHGLTRFDFDRYHSKPWKGFLAGSKDDRNFNEATHKLDMSVSCYKLEQQ